MRAISVGDSKSPPSAESAGRVGHALYIASVLIIVVVIEDTMIEDLYDLIGGRSTIEAATERFYDKVLQDESLRHVFEQADMAHLRSRQVMLISMLLGGRVYTGRNIRDAHAGSREHGLNDTHFDLFLAHFRAALEEVGVKPENAQKVMQRLESKRGTVLDT
jgi:hemoglobin